MTAPELTFEAFAQRLLQVLDEGRFVATYKFAVLLGLLDVLVETVGPDGRAPAEVNTRHLAAKVAEIYWPQTTTFTGEIGQLRQNQQGQAEIVRLIAAFREQTVGDESLPLARARWARPTEFVNLVRAVEWKLIEMPLGKLQRVGNQDEPFIYQLGWGQTPKASEVKGGDFVGRLLLAPGAGDHLLRGAALVRPLVQTSWALTVARFNKLEDARLQSFLFGAGRVSLAPVSSAIREIDHARCFYCRRAVRDTGQIDHFIPWARHIDNGLHNLVFSHDRCNGAKSVNLAAAQHVDRWLERSAGVADALDELATAKQWSADRDRTLAAARAIYLRLPDGYKLWSGGKDFVPVESAALAQLFAAA